MHTSLRLLALLLGISFFAACKKDKPAADFTWAVDGDQIVFTDKSEGSPESWFWDFGSNGAVSSEQNPTHAYTAPGDYNVCLTVTNENGSDTKCQSVTVLNVGPVLRFKFKLDPTQERLGNLGNPTPMPAGHAGQNPQFNGISAHYVELAQTQFTQIGDGSVLFKNEETTQGGSKAIVFNSEIIKNDGEVFLEVPLKQIPAGSYEWLRVSLAYQNYDVQFDVNVGGFQQTLTGTLASFVGYNTYIQDHQVKDSTLTVNANRLQGYWAFETIYSLNSGQAPVTTVPNPIQSTSPIPAGSCLVTGGFAQPFVITGQETSDVTVIVSLSINKSFEWEDLDGDGKWDPLEGENVVDMGLRGLKPMVE